MLRRLTGMAVSVSKLRAMALAYGDDCLHAQEAAAAGRAILSRTHTEGGMKRKPCTPSSACWMGPERPARRRIPPDVRAKNGEAGTRQIRVALFGEYGWLDSKGRPLPLRGSFSYAVSGEEIGEVSSLVRKLGMARGYGKAPRMQCVADGEEALEKALARRLPQRHLHQ